MRRILIPVVVLLSGCVMVIRDDTPVSPYFLFLPLPPTVDAPPVTVNIENPVPVVQTPAPVVAPVAPSGNTNWRCGVFDLPPPGTTPTLERFTSDTTEQEVIDRLTEHVLELRRFLTEDRLGLEEKHRQYLSRC